MRTAFGSGKFREGVLWHPFFCGICGGIGVYTGIDPTLIRLGWALFCVMGGSGILAYVIAAIIIPERTEY